MTQKTRDEAQTNFVNKWLNNNYKGTLFAVTAFGKTRTSIKCALASKASSTIVIVPTKELKKQWDKSLKEWKVPNFRVYVVNTAAKLELNCDLLILDECHTVAMADWFQLSWKNTKFNKIIGLSASPIRKDNKHKDFLRICPIIMSITFEEALSNGWVSDYDIYNVGINFTTAEQIEYDTIQNKLDLLYEAMASAHNCDVEYAIRKAFDLANLFLKMGTNYTKGLGARYYNLIGKRKNLLYNASNKLERTVNYIIKNPDKTVIVFSQSQEFADALQERLGDICVTIHSGLKDRQREYNLKRFKDRRTKVRVISSIKALNEGVDIPHVDCGIVASGTSSKKDAIQTLGRVIRLYKDKHAVFFNLYIKDSQDFIWLRNRQWDLDKSKIKYV